MAEYSSLGTSLLHADEDYAANELHVASPISVTTTYRSAEDEIDLMTEWNPLKPQTHLYSRATQNVTTRVEKVIGDLHGGYAITYTSGSAATYAALVHTKPKRILIGEGYHGTFSTIKVYQQSRDVPVPVEGLDSDYQQGDLVWLETPINPTGEARDIQYYANKVHSVGGTLIVDATFAPPPLQNPFKWGADIVMHSGSKYFGGHSDLLCGILVVKTPEEWKKLWSNRTCFGNVMGSLEAWLLLRSLRTHHLRIPRQSQTATALVAWLNTLVVGKGQVVDGIPGGLIIGVRHASLQDKTEFDPAAQLSGGYGATFTIILATAAQAKAFPHRLKYWTCASSLGGVESLIELRKRIDTSADPRWIRLSVGLEDFESLKDDLKDGLLQVANMGVAVAVEPIKPTAVMEYCNLGTSLLHADEEFINDLHVAPPISVTTTYRAEEEEIDLKTEWSPLKPQFHIYARGTQNVRSRVEKIIGELHGGHAITYTSGLAAIYAAFVHTKPKRIIIGEGYHGTYNVIKLYQQSRDVEVPVLSLDSEYQKGDLVWLETPLNPTGEARDIKYFADKVHNVGGTLIVDATFAPPPLQNPFEWGADIVMHSGSKYFGGHSDLLCGILVVKTVEEWIKLWSNRRSMGNVMGSLEAWLLLRSLRTHHLRIPRQSQTATALAAWLNMLVVPKDRVVDGVPGGLVVSVKHASLQDKTKFDPATQLSGGYGATFAMVLATAAQAKAFPHRLKYWTPATSLGGVESLIELRIRTDAGVDPRLIRLSVGVEDFESLRDDLKQGLVQVGNMGGLTYFPKSKEYSGSDTKDSEVP